MFHKQHVAGGIMLLMARKKLWRIPRFRDEIAERRFWETHDSADYVDLSKARRAIFPNLKLSTRRITLRLPPDILDRIKVAANRRDVPYKSLIKVWLYEQLDAELGRGPRRAKI
jgi:predicted DNA binding CopG/RHH family protein